MGEADQMRDSIEDIWGQRTPHTGEWPVRVDQRLSEEPDRRVQSCRILCSNGCGLDIGVKGNRIVGVRGREVDRVNKGRLGPKGLHGWVLEGSWTAISQAAQALRDKDLKEVCDNCGAETHRQIQWIATRIKDIAAQTLIAAP